MNPNTPQFVWHDLMTTDTAAATSFYKSVIGWNAADAGVGAGAYTYLSAGTTPVAGLMQIPESARAMGAGPSWMGYVGVGDIEARTARITAAGGKVLRPVDEIPGIGRFAVLADPQGAVFALFQPNNPPAPAAGAPAAAGHVGWNELRATDYKSAFAFYEKIFGWTVADEMDMGPMGFYLMFATGGTAVGGMANKSPEVPVPHWCFYFNVESIDSAMQRVAGHGGKVLHGPHEVPGSSWIAECVDPQGATFALVAPKR
jgi:predicted enzyme related to lactoylglutathione lyase